MALPDEVAVFSLHFEEPLAQSNVLAVLSHLVPRLLWEAFPVSPWCSPSCDGVLHPPCCMQSPGEMGES